LDSLIVEGAAVCDVAIEAERIKAAAITKALVIMTPIWMIRDPSFVYRAQADSPLSKVVGDLSASRM
jgi:hypothetical protein